VRDGDDAMIWDRRQVSVEISRKDGDNFRPPSLLTEVMHKPFATASHLAVSAGLAPISRGSHSSIRDERSSGRGNKVLKGVLFLCLCRLARSGLLGLLHSRELGDLIGRTARVAGI
jgi:transposase